MATIRLDPVTGTLVLGALAAGLALIPAWTVEGRLRAVSCHRESTGGRWSSWVTLEVQPSRGGHPLTFKADAAPGTCTTLGYWTGVPPAWRHDAPVRVTLRALTNPHAAPRADLAALLPTPRMQVVTGLEVDGRTVKRTWWGGV